MLTKHFGHMGRKNNHSLRSLNHFEHRVAALAGGIKAAQLQESWDDPVPVDPGVSLNEPSSTIVLCICPCLLQ